MLDVAESVARVVGGVLYGVGLSLGALGAYRARTERVAAGAGPAARIGATPAYLITAVPYFVVCAALWRGIPVDLGPWARVAALVVATVLGIAGAGLYVAGHLALGRAYDVSSGLGTVVHADAPLVTTGVYGWVRHPMYTGVALGAIAGLALYRTWTFVFVLGSLVAIARKARIEDALLAARYGPPYERYRETTPAFVPRLRSRPAPARPLAPPAASS